jgi:hypothetical protein
MSDDLEMYDYPSGRLIKAQAGDNGASQRHSAKCQENASQDKMIGAAHTKDKHMINITSVIERRITEEAHKQAQAETAALGATIAAEVARIGLEPSGTTLPLRDFLKVIRDQREQAIIRARVDALLDGLAGKTVPVTVVNDFAINATAASQAQIGDAIAAAMMHNTRRST